VKRVLVVSNPVASGITPEVERQIMRVFAGVLDAELVHTERQMHAAELAARGADAEMDAIIAAGGDGTVNEVLNGVGNRLPVGVLPCGGTSVLARSMGVSRNPVTAAGQVGAALMASRYRTLRLGTLNGRRFSFAAGIGLDADIVRRIDARGRAGGRRPGDITFGFELMRVLASGNYRAPQATLEARERSERVASVIAANVHPWTYVGRVGLKAAPLARPEAGFEIVAPRRLRRRDLPRFLRYLMISPSHARGDGVPEIAYFHDLTAAHVACDRPLPAQVDGDDIGDVTECVFGVDEAGARILV
jgi:diacylglycerol kinase family enzyme